MLSGLHNIGLATLSGFGEFSTLLSDEQDLATVPSWIDDTKTWLEQRLAKAEQLSAAWTESTRKELNALQKSLNEWDDQENLSAQLMSQWRGAVNGVDGAVIAEQLVVKKALQKAMATSFNDGWSLSALSGFAGFLNDNRYVGDPGPTFYDYQPPDGDWRIASYNASRIATAVELSTFMQYNRPGRLSSELSGLAPFFELNPWMVQSQTNYWPYGKFIDTAASAIANINAPLQEAIWDLSGELSVISSWTAPALENGKIVSKTFQTSAWAWAHRDDWPWPHYAYYKVRSQPAGAWWLGHASYVSLANLSSSYYTANPLFSEVKVLSAGTDMNFSQQTLFYKPERLPADLQKDVWMEYSTVNNDWSPIKFGYGSDYMPIWTTALVADTSQALKSRFRLGACASDINGMQFSLNDCTVLAQQLTPGTPLVYSGTGGYERFLDGQSQGYQSWQSGRQSLQLGNFIPFGGPWPEACTAGHMYGAINTYGLAGSQIEEIQSFCICPSIVSNDVSSVVWDYALSSEISGDVQPWYCMNFIQVQGQCQTMYNESISADVVRFVDKGYHMNINIGYVRPQTVRCNRENGQLVPDPNGRYLVAFQGLKTTRDIAAMANSLWTPVSTLPATPAPPSDNVDLRPRGYSFAYVDVCMPYFICLFIPWAGRFQILDPKETIWPGEVLEEKEQQDDSDS